MDQKELTCKKYLNIAYVILNTQKYHLQKAQRDDYNTMTNYRDNDYCNTQLPNSTHLYNLYNSFQHP